MRTTPAQRRGARRHPIVGSGDWTRDRAQEAASDQGTGGKVDPVHSRGIDTTVGLRLVATVGADTRSARRGWSVRRLSTPPPQVGGAVSPPGTRPLPQRRCRGSPRRPTVDSGSEEGRRGWEDSVRTVPWRTRWPESASCPCGCGPYGRNTHRSTGCWVGRDAARAGSPTPARLYERLARRRCSARPEGPALFHRRRADAAPFQTGPYSDA